MLIANLCKYVTVISEKQDDFEVVSKNPETKDLEDSLQMVCAENACLDYIVTRNIKDFIRAEGLIPSPSGAKQGVLNLTAIPYENTIPCHKVAYCSAAGLVIHSKIPALSPEDFFKVIM